MTEPIPHPVRPLVRPRDTHHYSLRTGRQRRIDQCWLARTPIAHHFNAWGGQGSAPAVGPVRPAISSPDELPPARLVIHRQTPYDVLDTKIRWYEETGSGMARFFTLQLLATDNGRLCITSERHGEAASFGGGGGTPLSTEFRARNHGALEHINLLVGHGCSGMPLSSTRLPQHGLTLREDHSGKWALETPYHARIVTSPLDTTGYVSGPAEPNVTWDTNFPR